MKNKKNNVNYGKSALGIILAVALVLLLSHPEWLPLSQKTKQSVSELQNATLAVGANNGGILPRLITLALVLAIIWLTYQVVKLILHLLGKHGRRSQTVTDLLAGLLKYIAVIVAIVWGLNVLGVNTTAVLAGLGIIGLVLGFGAQSLIEDIITGAFIIFENQYAIGDIIVLDDFRGTVRSIGVRTTVIEDAGGNLKVVNNSDIRNFQNRSKKNSIALVEVSVDYSTDLRKLEKLLEDKLPDLLEQHKDLYLAVPRYLGVDALADSGVNLKFVVDTKEENVFSSQRMLARDLKILFDDNGIGIPFPQVVVHKGD